MLRRVSHQASHQPSARNYPQVPILSVPMPDDADEWYRRGLDQYLDFTSLFDDVRAKDNFAAAAELFRRAAERGPAPAQEMLGSCYDAGHGVAK